MDTEGRSPIHHENFDWSTMDAHNSNRRVEKVGDVFRKRGSGWGSEENQIVTRFTLYNELQRVTGTQQVQRTICSTYNWNGSCRTWANVTENVPVLGPASSWAGCVETRPGTLAYDVTPPSSQNPSSLFVPM